MVSSDADGDRWDDFAGLKGEVFSDAVEGEGRGVRMPAAKGCLGCGDRLTAGSEEMVRVSLLGSRECAARKFGRSGTLPAAGAFSRRDSDFGGMAGVAGLEICLGDTGDNIRGAKECCRSDWR